jgi:hypothetical protein
VAARSRINGGGSALITEQKMAAASNNIRNSGVVPLAYIENNGQDI